MWTTGNYRRNLLDMHISDERPEFLSKINVSEYVEALKEAGIQAAVVKAKPHTGLCYWPASIGDMHKGLHGYDYFGEMVKACHENGIAVVAYYSQIYDNWAYDAHPSWRLVTPEGKGFKELNDKNKMHQTGRYGIVCPNNMEYRAYVKHNLEELNQRYDFEGMFLDMTFWPEVCFCDQCRERFLHETGHEIPRIIDWEDPIWMEFADKRNEWIREFTSFSTNIVKSIKPEVTVEHNFAMVMSLWRFGCTELQTNEMDYVSGDFYGGYLQQSFICKYYNSVSKTLPFNYDTSRCTPSLSYHTTTKEISELIVSAITSLIHNGAFLNVDAINPDGTIDINLYKNTLKGVFKKTRKYEKYVSNEIDSNVAIWFSTSCKQGGSENGLDVSLPPQSDNYYYSSPVEMAGILKKYNVPYSVIGSKNLASLEGKTLIIPYVPRITDNEMDDIERFVLSGGHIYLSGCIGHKRLERLLGVESTGTTKHTFTYIAPTTEGTTIFDSFTEHSPLTIPFKQSTVKIIDENCIVMGKIVLPYTLANANGFSAIHSDPPGEITNEPAVILKNVGKGQIMWVSAPIEITHPNASKKCVFQAIKMLTGNLSFYSNAPAEVEIIMWHKDDQTYLAVINQDEQMQFSPVYDLYVKIPGLFQQAFLIEDGKQLKTENDQGFTKIFLPKLNLFHIVHVS